MQEIINQINEEKLVAIVRMEDSSVIEPVVEALYNGGIRLIEITMNTPGAVQAIEKASNMYDDLLVGAGTVLDTAAATSAINAGAQFMLSPVLDNRILSMGHEAHIPVIPGVMTPTEAFRAYELGAKIIKVFPVRSLGSDFIKDLRGPLPFLNVMGVGGISLTNASDFLAKGWNSLGIGSSLVSSELMNQGGVAALEEKARQFVLQRDKTLSGKQ